MIDYWPRNIYDDLHDTIYSLLISLELLVVRFSPRIFCIFYERPNNPNGFASMIELIKITNIYTRSKWYVYKS